MRVLHITNRARTGGWLAEAFAADSASDVDLQQAIGTQAGLTRLRDEAFDAVLVSHEPGELDALDLIEGYRAGGADEPIIVLGSQSEQEMAALCYEVGADAYLCANTTTTRHLIWTVARAVQRHQLVCENRRLDQAERQRLGRERDEAERLIAYQWAVVGTAAEADLGTARRPPALPEVLVAHYRELLRTYVIMGSGNLACELQPLAEWLATAGVTSRQTLEMHLHVLEELIQGLGARSTRHVMNRADLLVMEILVELAESYHHRYQQRVRPPVQMMLPGFDEPLPATF
jgi:DNA-binding response OmpR family regulator